MCDVLPPVICGPRRRASGTEVGITPDIVDERLRKSEDNVILGFAVKYPFPSTPVATLDPDPLSAFPAIEFLHFLVAGLLVMEVDARANLTSARTVRITSNPSFLLLGNEFRRGD
jgi:hypothetical protein